MSEARFDLVILHHTSDKTVENLVQELLVILGKVGDPYLEYKLSEALLFEQSSSAILDDIRETEGRAIQEQFRNLSVETELRPTLQLVAKEEPASDENAEQYICPSCNHSQPKQTDEEIMNTCNKCGLVGEKLKKNQKKEEVYQSEKRKLEQTQTKKMKEAVERAHYDEEETLRKEARERLGIKNKNRKANIAVGVAVVGAMGVSAFFIADTLRSSGEEDTANEMIAVENTDKEKKPLITIQAGNGSVVINQGNNSGTGGAKGTNGGEAPIVGGSPTSSFDTVSMSQQPHAKKNNGTSSDQGSGNNSTAPANQAMQLAAAANKTQRTTAESIQKRAAVKKFLSNANTPPEELEVLKTILSAGPQLPDNFLTKLDTKQFQEHQKRLKRLLTLNKPGLALVFAEGIDDPYPASLMALEVAKYETDRQSVKLYDDIMLTVKNLASLGNSVQSNAMLNSSLSQAYFFTGDKEASLALLEESIRQLDNDEINAEQQCQALIQIEKTHRQFGNQTGAEFASEALKQYAENLAPDEYIDINRAYTHLAAASFAGAKQDDAKKWLQKIPVNDAREFLLSQLETMNKQQNTTASNQ